MKWDAVEREFYVIGNHLMRLSEAFQALACELRRERESVRMSSTQEAVTQSRKSKEGGDGPAEPALPF